MNYKIEQIIDDMKDSINYTDLGYSAGQSIDRNYCPICGADEVIRYNSDQPRITMETLEHEDNCLYSLVRKLEKELEEQLSIKDLSTLKDKIKSDSNASRFPNAKEYNAGLKRGTEIAIDSIELLEELYSEDEY